MGSNRFLLILILALLFGHVVGQTLKSWGVTLWPIG